MKYVYLILNWGFGILFSVMAISSLFKAPLASLPLILISLLLLPPSREFFYKKSNKSLSIQTRSFLVITLMVGFGALLNIGEEDRRKQQALEQAQLAAEKIEKQRVENVKYFKDNRDKIIADIRNLVKKEKFNTAANLALKYLDSKDEELSKIHLEAKTQYLLSELKKLPSNKVEKNKEIYQGLARLHPDNKKYKEKLDHYNKMISKKEEKERLAKKRKDDIQKQFSAWDGSHYKLEKLIKNSMNDPDSYEHVKTDAWDKGDHLIIKTTFRGKNAFGGVVKNTVKAKVSLDGTVVQVIEQY